MPELTGTLVRCSDSSATVRVDGGVREVEFEATDGSPRQFRATRSTTTTWAPATLVEPITLDPEENAMSPKKTTKRSATAPNRAKSPKAAKTVQKTVQATTKAQKSKPAGSPKPQKLSALDAAAQVLAASKEPMTTKQMIEAMASRGLWTSPGGKTPHATLYSAILREIGTKGKEARFKKTDRGHFAANG
jgi:hypothetical protein